MRLLLVTISLLIIITPAFSYEERNILLSQISRDDLKASLVVGQQWVNYPAYINRSGWDSFLGSYKNYYIERGESRIHYEWKIIKATDYLEYERTGNRSIMEVPFEANNSAFADLLMAELAEGKGRFMDQLINGVFYYCEMTTWAVSAHVPLQKSKRALPSDKDQVLDLFAGEVGNMLSWTYYFMKEAFDKVDPEISRRLRSELHERIIEPYLNNNTFWWMARGKEGSRMNNWNPWCNSNALIVFALLENDKDILANAVYESMRSVDQYLNYVKSDGACDEGPSYWLNAAGRLLDYLQMISTITNDKVNVFNVPMIRKMGEYICDCYVGNGWSVNYADASARGIGDAYIAYRFGAAVNSNKLKRYAGHIRKYYSAPVPSASIYRILTGLEVEARLASEPGKLMVSPFVWYPETEYCYMTNSNGLFLGTKGGHNNESHNHNDVGSFNFYIDQTPIIIDVGVGGYTAQTFSDDRYEIWTMQSNYHNLPMINGVAEKEGGEYKCKSVLAKKNFFSADISGAYPEEAKVEKWSRSYILKENELLVIDSFILKEATVCNVINFMIWGEVAVEQPGKVTLSCNGVKATVLYDYLFFDLTIDTISLQDPILYKVWGDKVYRLSFTAKKQAKKGIYTFRILKENSKKEVFN